MHCKSGVDTDSYLEQDKAKFRNAFAEHYGIANLPVLRYFVKHIMANLTKPTSILSIYNDIKSQGLRISKDELYCGKAATEGYNA